MSIDSDWEDVGTVAVDSGHIWIGDPCYVFDPRTRPTDLGRVWDDVVPKLISADAVQWLFDGGSPGLGISIESGYGDGGYVVKVKRSPDGYVQAAMIEFIPK